MSVCPVLSQLRTPRMHQKKRAPFFFKDNFCPTLLHALISCSHTSLTVFLPYLATCLDILQPYIINCTQPCMLACTVASEHLTIACPGSHFCRLPYRPCRISHQHNHHMYSGPCFPQLIFFT